MADSIPLKILIADDDPQLRFCLRTKLLNLGHQVMAEAQDGQQVISLAQQLRPDLIIMDIRMPKIDGLEASRQIGQKCPCPIILLSAYSDPELVRRASALRVQAYLIRPVREWELEPAIALAVARFREAKALEDQLTHMTEILDVRIALKQAVSHLIERERCSAQEAWERIEQEAMAKRAKLYEAAQAIVLDEPLPYQHDVPI
jgi:AmiR/NasT family two-component response regulator